MTRLGRVSSLAVLLLIACGEPTTGPADGGSDTGIDGGSGGRVAVSIDGEVLLANGYPGQLLPLFRADLGSGSALARVALFARFCSDAACESELFVVPITLEDADANGRYVLSSASLSGVGFAKAFTITEAPLGTSYVQIIGDTQMSVERGLGACGGTTACPGDFDVVQTEGYQVGQNTDGLTAQPPAATMQVTVSAAGASLSLPSTVYLGHLELDPGPLAAEAPGDTGTLVAAMSNADDTYRNFIALIDLDDPSANPGTTSSASYVLQKAGAAFAGDVCGLVRGGTTLYAIGVDDVGTHVFRLSAATGLQLSDTPAITVPPGNVNDPATFHWPCRGVFGSMGGKDHLYLVAFKGAGSLTTSSPYPFYDVNLTDGVVTTPIAETQLALRAVALDGTSHLFALDMSWSQYSVSNDIDNNRILELTRDVSGTVTGVGTTTETTLTSDEQCDSNLHWPTGAAVVSIGGTPRLLVGHDSGVAVYDVSTHTQITNVLLPNHGRLFSEIVPSGDGSRVYALPQCKAINSDTTFRLPYAVVTEYADTNLVAILDTAGSALAMAATTLDIDGNGTPDHGIDLDYYFLKKYIRDHGTTLPIPPVVYTGPQLAVGQSMLFVRGTGIQGNGSNVVSSSGMGQVQDVGFFSLATGRGMVFGDYMPWTDGLSSEGGTNNAIWGYDVHAGKESSVGAIAYLPAP